MYSYGLGIGIVAAHGVRKEADIGLRAIDARHLFRSGTINVGVPRDRAMSRYALHLIRLFAPEVSGRYCAGFGSVNVQQLPASRHPPSAAAFRPRSRR